MVGKQAGRKEPRGRGAWVEFDGVVSEGVEEDSEEKVETKGWDRGSSSSSRVVCRRFRLRFGGALWDGRRRIVDSTLPASARGSRARYHSVKVVLRVALCASGDVLAIYLKSIVRRPR